MIGTATEFPFWALPLPSGTPRRPAEGGLRRIADEDNAAPQRRYAAMVDARIEGASWDEIGDALGITRQAAQQFVAQRERSPR